MTLVDVLVGSAMMLIIFVGITGAYNLSLATVGLAREKTSALAIVTDKIESLRSLPYSQLGTVGGIPSGAIAQTATSSLNGMTFIVRTLIQYADAPEDGLGASDTNSVTADYKIAKVEASWTSRNIPHTLSLATTIAPQGVEQLGSGGTLTINVLNSIAQAVQGASVRVTNASTTPTIDVTALSNASGSVSFPGSPPASNYKITVTKTGYSTSQTYDATVANPNPTPAHLSVVNGQTTSSSFSIDTLGALHLYTYSPAANASWSDDFTDTSKIATQSNTSVSGGALNLTVDGDGNYPSSGTAQSVGTSSQYLANWSTVSWNATTPANTSAKYQVLYLTEGSYALIPDSALAGNSTGFTNASLDISTLPIATYTSLALRAMLATTHASSTPSVDSWGITYGNGPTPLGNVGLSIHGAKVIGSQAGGGPVYKYDQNVTTTQYGEWNIDPLEWDGYTIATTGSYDASEICPFSPVSLLPGVSTNVSITAVANTTNTLLVYVATGSSAAIQGATVTLTGPMSRNGTTSACGQAFFSGLTSGTYTLTVAKTGYTTYQANISVSNDVRQSVTLQ